MAGCRNGGAAPALTDDVEPGGRSAEGDAWGEVDSWAVTWVQVGMVEEEPVCKSSLPLAVMGRRPATVLSKVPAR